MRRRVLLLAALCLTVAAAWIVRARGERTEARGAGVGDQATALSTAPALEGRLGATASRSEPPAAPPAPPATPEVWVGKTLRGRVVFPDGTPAAHAKVVLGSIARSGVTRMLQSFGDQADADSSGAFEIAQLEPALYGIRIEAERDGREGRYSGEVEPGGRDIVFRLEEGRERLRVRVLDPDGVPAPSACLHLVAEDRGAYAFASDGVARFLEYGDQPHEGPATLVVQLFYDELGENERPWAPIVVEGIEAATREVTVRTERGGVIAGRVEGPALGAGHAVIASPERSGIRRWFSHREVKIGADGRFRFEAIPAGTWRLYVRGPLWRDASDVVNARAGDVDVVLRPHATTSARVRVVDPTGRPVLVARVWCSQPDCDTADFTLGPADAGVARLDGLRPGLGGALGATSDEGGHWSGFRRDWTPSDTTLVLERAREGRVAGVVRDVAGAPVPRVVVNARQGERVSAVRADDVGRFHFDDLDPGPVALEGRLGSGHGPADGTALAQCGDADVRLVVDLGHRLRVVVVNWPYGADREGATLVEEGDESTSGAVVPPLAFTFEGILFAGLRSAATYTLIVRAPGTDYFARLEGVRADEDRSIRLAPGTSLFGRVLFAGGSGGAGEGVRVEDLREIEVRGQALGIPVEGTVDSDGRYAIDALPLGTKVELTATAIAPDGTRLTAHAVGASGDKSVDLPLRP